MTPPILYEETQELAWPWSAVGLWSMLVGGWSLGAARGPVAGLVGAAAFALGASALAAAFLFPLRTRVFADQIELRFGRYTRFLIPVNEIASAEPVTYHPLRDYGGWGIRFSGKGRAYSMRGNTGVQLTLTDGRRILIGSGQPAELAAAIRTARDSAARSPTIRET